jgi:fructokinase
MTTSGLLAGVELGGTKCVCVLGAGPADLREQERVATRDPATTLAQIEAVLSRWRDAHGPFEALGVASFGPLDLARTSPTYGHITATTKPGWSNTPIASRFAQAFGVPVGFDTDVNGAALGEGQWGAAQGLDNFAYVTVGTGVGVGLIVDGKTVFGCSHTEMGHIRIVRFPGDTWPGHCSFHGDCVEGLASGPAIEARSGGRADALPDDHPVLATVVHALAQLLHTMVVTTAPQRIIIGGGVLASREGLVTRVRAELVRSLNGYVKADQLMRDTASYVVPPALGAISGALGALVLAARALESDAEFHGRKRYPSPPSREGGG